VALAGPGSAAVGVRQRAIKHSARCLPSHFHHLMALGRLEVIFPDCLDEQFPLYALRPSRHLPPNTRAFLDFVIATIRSRSARPH
jgi:DNA-binding transcriptional LysR family regulator